MAKRNWGKPTYTHDTCGACRFLGRMDAVVEGDEPYDLWVCNRGLSVVGFNGKGVARGQIAKDGSVITRFVEELNREVCLDPKTDPFLSVAYERAMEKDID